MPRVEDLYSLPEDARIGVIAQHARQGKDVMFLVDDDTYEKGKADRYVRKIEERFPDLEVYDRHPGPMKQVITLRVRLRPQ